MEKGGKAPVALAAADLGDNSLAAHVKRTLSQGGAEPGTVCFCFVRGRSERDSIFYVEDNGSGMDAKELAMWCAVQCLSSGACPSWLKRTCCDVDAARMLLHGRRLLSMRRARAPNGVHFAGHSAFPFRTHPPRQQQLSLAQRLPLLRRCERLAH